MTETELADRLRESIILDGPGAAQAGSFWLEAEQLGLSPEATRKLAARVGDEVRDNAVLIDSIRTRIARLLEPSRVHLYEQDLPKILNAAGSLHLSASFVRNRWIPVERARRAATLPVVEATPETPAAPVIPPEPIIVPPAPEPPVVTVPPVAAPVVVPELTPAVPEPPVVPPAPEPIWQPPARTEPAPVRTTRPAPGPAPVVRSFTATPARVRKGGAVTLDWEVANVLAVTIDDLGEGLSPKNRGWVKPTKTTDYTLFDANNNPLSTVRVEVIPPDRSGLYGVLFALALLALIYWFVRTGAGRTTQRQPETTQQDESLGTSRETGPFVADRPAGVTPAPDESIATDTKEPEPAVTETEPAATGSAQVPAESAPAETAPAETPEAAPASPADARIGKYEEVFGDKPYDKIEIGADERGWRRARKKGRWGFVDQDDNWVIPPRFEAITPFRENMASAFLDGQLMTISRTGDAIKP